MHDFLLTTTSDFKPTCNGKGSISMNLCHQITSADNTCSSLATTSDRDTLAFFYLYFELSSYIYFYFKSMCQCKYGSKNVKNVRFNSLAMLWCTVFYS